MGSRGYTKWDLYLSCLLVNFLIFWGLGVLRVLRVLVSACLRVSCFLFLLCCPVFFFVFRVLVLLGSFVCVFCFSLYPQADLVLLETDVSSEVYPQLARFLSGMRKGSHALTYLDLRKMWGNLPFPYRQVDINRPLSDRFPTSWSVNRGHHFFLWNKVVPPLDWVLHGDEEKASSGSVGDTHCTTTGTRDRSSSLVYRKTHAGTPPLGTAAIFQAEATAMATAETNGHMVEREGLRADSKTCGRDHAGEDGRGCRGAGGGGGCNQRRDVARI